MYVWLLAAVIIIVLLYLHLSEDRDAGEPPSKDYMVKRRPGTRVLDPAPVMDVTDSQGEPAASLESFMSAVRKTQPPSKFNYSSRRAAQMSDGLLFREELDGKRVCSCDWTRDYACPYWQVRGTKGYLSNDNNNDVTNRKCFGYCCTKLLALMDYVSEWEEASGYEHASCAGCNCHNRGKGMQTRCPFLKSANGWQDVTEGANDPCFYCCCVQPLRAIATLDAEITKVSWEKVKEVRQRMVK